MLMTTSITNDPTNTPAIKANIKTSPLFISSKLAFIIVSTFAENDTWERSRYYDGIFFFDLFTKIVVFHNFSIILLYVVNKGMYY
jgi:hypothetical protein